jgi:TonB family protein
LKKTPLGADNTVKQFDSRGVAMNKNIFRFHPSRMRRGGVQLMRAAVLALAVVMTIPAWAAVRPVKSRVEPIYPELAKRMKIEGVVKLEATVDAEGKVTDVKKVSGNSLLSMAAEDAVHKWKYESGSGTSTVEVELTFAIGR